MMLSLTTVRLIRKNKPTLKHSSLTLEGKVVAALFAAFYNLIEGTTKLCLIETSILGKK